MTASQERTLESSLQERARFFAKESQDIKALMDECELERKKLLAELDSAKSKSDAEHIFARLRIEDGLFQTLYLGKQVARELSVLWDIQALTWKYVDVAAADYSNALLIEIRKTKERTVSELAQKYDVSHEGILRHLNAVLERREGRGLEEDDKKDE